MRNPFCAELVEITKKTEKGLVKNYITRAHTITSSIRNVRTSNCWNYETVYC